MKENKFLQNDYGLAYVNPHGIGYKCESFQVRFPPQHQNRQPGMEYVMTRSRSLIIPTIARVEN